MFKSPPVILIENGGLFMDIFMKCLYAFSVGGAICFIGQILIDYTKLTPARILVSYVVAGVVLTAIGVYEPLVDFAGSGATVPLCGFGYSLATGVKQAVNEYGLIGALSGGLTGTASGITAAMIFGYMAALISRPGIKSFN